MKISAWRIVIERVKCEDAAPMDVPVQAAVVDVVAKPISAPAKPSTLVNAQDDVPVTFADSMLVVACLAIAIVLMQSMFWIIDRVVQANLQGGLAYVFVALFVTAVAWLFHPLFAVKTALLK